LNKFLHYIKKNMKNFFIKNYNKKFNKKFILLDTYNRNSLLIFKS